MTMEFAVGRAAQKSPSVMFRELEPPKSKWHFHGIVCLVGCVILMMFYNNVSGWMINYFFKTATGTFEGMGSEGVNVEFGNMLGDPVWQTVFMAVALIFIDPILYFFGASENTLPYAKEYIQIILYGNIVTHLYFGLNAAMRSSGNPKKAMALTIFTVVFNTILDPIFIFVFDMGIAGAAWATVIAQTAAMIVVLKHFSDKSRAFHFEKGIFKLDPRVAKDSLVIGMGPFLMNAAACLVTLFINQQLRDYSGDLGIGSYGICNRFIFMFIMICMGLNQGMQPIVGFNYGAKQFLRVKETLKLTILYATAIMTLGFLLAEIFPRQIVMIFTTDEELIQQAIKGMRIVFACFPIVGFQIVTGNFFQSVGMAGKSVFMSLTRQLLFLLPGLLIFPYFFQDNGIWMSMPISDGLSSLVAFIMLYNQMKKFKQFVYDQYKNYLLNCIEKRMQNNELIIIDGIHIKPGKIEIYLDLLNKYKYNFYCKNILFILKKSKAVKISLAVCHRKLFPQ